MDSFTFSEKELRILGAATIVPPRYLTPRDFEIIVKSLRQRFTPEGRKLYAAESCLLTEKHGFSVPLDEKSTISLEDCEQEILRMDFEVYPDEEVESLLQRFESFVGPSETPEGSLEAKRSVYV